AFRAAAVEWGSAQADEAGERLAVTERTAEHLERQIGRGSQAEAIKQCQRLDLLRRLVRLLFRQHHLARRLDLLQLLAQQLMPRQQPPQLRHQFRWQWLAAEAAQRRQLRGRLLQAWLEAAYAVQAQQVLHPVLQRDP